MKRCKAWARCAPSMIASVLLGLLVVQASFVAQAAQKQDHQAVVMLKTVSDNMLSSLKKDHHAIIQDEGVLYRIVDEALLPHVYKEGMARSVIGRSYWLKATAPQRRQFMDAFIRLVTHTYGDALSSYDNQTITFLPLRRAKNKHQLEVPSLIVHAHSEPPISVKYRVVERSGEWKVYDFVVNGVSLVQSYHSQFAGVLSQKGLTGLIQQLVQHNNDRAS